jgi:hypothetical protein
LAEGLAEWGGCRKFLFYNDFRRLVTASLPTSRVMGW